MSKVLEIYISEKGNAPMKTMETIVLEAGRGIIGDRYYNESGTFSEKLAGLPDKEITLIESEKIHGFNQAFGYEFDAGDFRRNIVTEGVQLNDLVDKEFAVGDVILRGIRLCEPCAHLADVLVPDIIPALVHQAGLRAAIIASGNVQIGDKVLVK